MKIQLPGQCYAIYVSDRQAEAIACGQLDVDLEASSSGALLASEPSNAPSNGCEDQRAMPEVPLLMLVFRAKLRTHDGHTLHNITMNAVLRPHRRPQIAPARPDEVACLLRTLRATRAHMRRMGRRHRRRLIST